DRNGVGERSQWWVELAVAGEDADLDLDAGGERTGCGEDEIVPVAVGQRAGEGSDGVVVRRPEVEPPEGCGGDQGERGQGDERSRVLRVAEGLDDGVGRSEQALAEQDEDEESVSLGDVVRVPRGVADAFGDDRDGDLSADHDDLRDLEGRRGE